MVTRDLLHYIATGFKKHIARDAVEKRLFEVGWNKEDITAAFVYVKSRFDRARHLQTLTFVLTTVTLLSTTAYFVVPDTSLQSSNQSLQTKNRQRAFGIITDDPAFYVATDGDDDNSGTINSPFATITKARDAIRALGEDGVTVYVRAGTYEIADSISFDASDSGTTGLPNTYRNYPGEYPVFKGGKTITLPAGQSGILDLDLSTYGLTGKTIDGIVRDGSLQTIARTPNAVTPNYVEGTDPWEGAFAHVSSATPGNTTVIGYEDGSIVDPATWSTPTNGRVFIHTYYNWSQSRLPIGSVNAAADTITLATGAEYNINYSTGGSPSQRNYYFVENLPEFIDVPGEWSQAGNIVKYLVSGTTTGTETLDMLHTSQPFIINDSSHVVFRNLSIEGAARPNITTQGGTFTITDADHIELDGITINNSEDVGVMVRGASEYVSIKNSRLTNIRGSAINMYLDGAGVDFFKDLHDTNNVIENNYIKSIGFHEHGGGAGSGVIVSMPGVTVRHNYLEDISSVGIASFLRNVNITIEDNYITKVMRQHRDGAAIYANSFSNPGYQRSWIPRNLQIRNNIIDDTGGYGYDSGTSEFVYKSGDIVVATGIYLDDKRSGTTIANNILQNVSSSCFFNHAGRDNIYENNICYASSLSPTILFSENSDTAYGVQDPMWVEVQDMANQGYSSAWLSTFPTIADVPEAPLPGQLMENNIFRKNIIYIKDGATGFIHWADRLNTTSTFTNNIYRPKSGDTFRVGSALASECLAVSPYTCTPSHKTFAQWQGHGFDTDSVVADPLFVDAPGGDFSLQSGSPALDEGFIPIDTSDTGNVSVLAGVSGITLESETVTIGDDINVDWDTPGLGNYETFRYRLITEVGSEIISWQNSDVGSGSFSTTGLDANSYQVCVAGQNDLRVPATGVASGWGAESCSSVFSVAPPAPGTPTPTPTPTDTPSASSTPTSTPTPTSSASASSSTSSSESGGSTSARGTSSPTRTPSRSTTGESTETLSDESDATATPTSTPSTLEVDSEISPTPSVSPDSNIETEPAKQSSSLPLKAGFGFLGIVNGLGARISTFLWRRAQREIP